MNKQKQLSEEEARLLTDQINASFKEVRGALIEIRDKRLWRGEAASFEDYCKKWGISHMLWLLAEEYTESRNGQAGTGQC